MLPPLSTAHWSWPSSVGFACNCGVRGFLLATFLIFLVTSTFIHLNAPIRKSHLFPSIIYYSIIIYNSMDLMSFANY